MEIEYEEIKEKPEPEPKVIGIENMQIPECCREGWPSCKHVIKPQQKVKRNIGL